MAVLATTGIGRHGPQIDLKQTAIAYSWALGEYPMHKITAAIKTLTKESAEPVTAAAVARQINSAELSAEEKNKKWEHYAE